MARDNTLLLNDVAFLEHNLIRFLAPFRTILTAAAFGTVFFVCAYYSWTDTNVCHTYDLYKNQIMPLYNHQPKKNRIIHEIWWFALLFARIGIKYFVKPNFVSLRFNVYSLFHVVKYECEFNWKQEIQKLGPIIAIINGAYKKLVTSKCHEIAQTLASWHA